VKKDIDNSGQAFPRQQWEYDGAGNVLEYQENGMSMRDYFAGKALQGLLANPKLANEILAKGGCKSGWIELSAYAFADAMLKAREA